MTISVNISLFLINVYLDNWKYNDAREEIHGVEGILVYRG